MITTKQLHGDKIAHDRVSDGADNMAKVESDGTFEGKLQVGLPVSAVQKSLPMPWRKPPPFNEEYLMTLKRQIQEYRPPEGLNLSEVRILMIGPVGAGKSSFANTINSVLQDKITTGLSLAGNTLHDATSLTMMYRQFNIRSRGSERPLNFRLCDTCGIEVNEGPDLVDLHYLVEGNVPDGYQFDPRRPISPKIKGFRSEPELKDKIHCVIFVFDASSLKITPTALWDKVNQLQKRMGVIPRFAILTKIDTLWDKLRHDVSEMFVSKDVEDAVDAVSTKLGIIRGNVLPIQNYENDVCLDYKVSILALQALDRMLSDADSYLYNRKDLMEIS